MTDSLNVAVYGLGSMGFGIAQSLVRAGHTTYGFDPRAEQCDALITLGGHHADESAIASTLHAVMVVVLNEAQTQSVLFGSDTAESKTPGVVSRLAPGAVVLSCATVAPTFAQQMQQQCAEYGVHYLDAPISGGAAKAQPLKRYLYWVTAQGRGPP